MHTPGRGDGALRRHRLSLSETSYFLTLCTANRSTDLTHKAVAFAIRAEISAIEADGHWAQRAGTIMPDHLHLLARTTGALPIARCIARLKSKTRTTLLAHGLSWQPNFYEHRLRPSDAIEDVVHYIFLNPYRADSISAETLYPWFWLGEEEAAWFNPGTHDNRPFPEWLR